MDKAFSEKSNLFERDQAGNLVGVDFTSFTPVDKVPDNTWLNKDLILTELFKHEKEHRLNNDMSPDKIILVFFTENCYTCNRLADDLYSSKGALEGYQIYFIFNKETQENNYQQNNYFETTVYSKRLFEICNVTSVPFAVVINKEICFGNVVGSLNQLIKLVNSELFR